MKKLIMITMMILLSISLVAAHEEHNFNETKILIDSKIPCSQLDDERLELLGDYYMEQMHPGEAHEVMDEMMGGEGSAQLKQMHILMAKRIYCKDSSSNGSGMMTSNGYMMGAGGMMNMMWSGLGGFGEMMGGFGTRYWSLFSVLYLILVVGLIVLIILAIIKLWKSLLEKKK